MRQVEFLHDFQELATVIDRKSAVFSEPRIGGKSHSQPRESTTLGSTHQQGQVNNACKISSGLDTIAQSRFVQTEFDLLSCRFPSIGLNSPTETPILIAPPASLIEEFDRLIRQDPARRGLISTEPQFGPLCANHLYQAAAHLAESAVRVAIVTGFYVPNGQHPAAETDGPPGALMLATALEAIGIETNVVTDCHCLPAVQAAANAVDYARAQIVCYPHNDPRWRKNFLTSGPGATCSHLISIERVGPSHTPASIAGQLAGLGPEAAEAADLAEFAASVAAGFHDRCHNMRGDVIDGHTSDLHRLFEELREHRPHAKTIGIGDGGNEIGMGVVPWKELRRRLCGEQAPRIPCRIATDWNIIAGTSNWGGYALAAAVLLLRGRVQSLKSWTGEYDLRLLEQMIEHGPAVDGVTGRREPTVDGLPYSTYRQPWEAMRRLLGL
jgi:D-glutamate cyclase